jgi:hypothetical protein
MQLVQHTGQHWKGHKNLHQEPKKKVNPKRFQNEITLGVVELQVFLRRSASGKT